MLKIFNKEYNSKFKGDVCQIAALYIHGGYYLDLELKRRSRKES